jgi:opacity protein-like surface antigen
MKKLLFLALAIVVTSITLSAQKIRLNGYTSYLFDDNHVGSYYSSGPYFEGAIKGGFQWGGGIEFMAAHGQGIEIKYLRQDALAPMDYSNGILTKHNDFELGINYILLSSNRYFVLDNEKIEPFVGAGLGVALIGIKNPTPDTDSSQEKFAWTLQAGTNIWLNESVGIKLQASLLSAVQSVGGGFYFGTGGVGAGVNSYSTMYQFGLGGGLVFKLGQ